MSGEHLPPDPAKVATRLSDAARTQLGEATKFLYTGSNPTQTGVDQTKIVGQHAAVLRADVFWTGVNRYQMSESVSMVILSWIHVESGRRLVDMAVNRGGVLTVDYQKSGLFPVQRTVTTEWLDYANVPDVVLMAPDSAATVIDLKAT